MSVDFPELPAVYELVILDRVDCVVEEAARRAAGGAGEGTVIWAREQSAARTPSGNDWYAPAGNLHCALIIEPDYDNLTAAQLVYVAMISAGTAIAEIVAPMTGLRWRWPDEILINDLDGGRVMMKTPRTESARYPWLVLGLSVNVAEHPPNPEPERFNSLHASGTPEATVAGLLEGFCRHFLSSVNRWAEEGFAPVRKAWLMRAEGIGERVSFAFPGGRVEGTLKGLDADGGLEVELEAGGTRTLSVEDYFSAER